MFGRIKALIEKEFRQTFRDPRMRAMIFITPVFQVLIFGYAATTDVNHVPTAIYDLDNTRQSRDLVRAFTSSNYFDVKQFITDDSQLNEVFDHSIVNTVIHINHGFARDIFGNNNPKVQLIVDGKNTPATFPHSKSLSSFKKSAQLPPSICGPEHGSTKIFFQKTFTSPASSP